MQSKKVGSIHTKVHRTKREVPLVIFPAFVYTFQIFCSGHENKTYMELIFKT